MSKVEFVTNLIDYAGLFPPAKLDLTTTLSNYLDYQAGGYNNLLARLVIPASLLAELFSVGYQNQPIPLSVISSNLESDMELILDAVNKSKGNLQVESIETKFPDNSAEHTSFIATSMEAALKLDTKPRVFFELAGLEDWQTRLQSALEPLTEFELAAFKLRCGGTQLPSALEVSQAILACSSTRVPMKFTAGLHHPIYSGKEHGFVNVFFAAMLAYFKSLELEQILKIVEAQSPPNIVTEGTAIEWNNQRLRSQDITMLRSKFVVSFGSCSFDEPIEDLSAMGWLND